MGSWREIYEDRKDSADPEWLHMVEHFAWEEHIESELQRFNELVRSMKNG